MNHLERKNKKKNFVWNAIGLSFNAFNSLFFLIIVKLVNGLDVAGIFTYAFSLGCLFFVLATYYNRAFQVSDHKNKFNFNQYFTARIVLSVVSILLIIVFSLISQFDLYKMMVIVLIMGFRCLEAISDCFYGAIQKNGELYKTGISYTIKAIGGVILFLILDLLTHNLLLSIGILIAINLGLLILYDIPNYYRFAKTKIRFNFSKIPQLLKICLPVFLFSLLSVYLANCQKYILTYFTSNDLQTIFGILVMPATMISLVGSYLINPAMNNLTKYHTQHRYDLYFKTTITILLLMALFGVLLLVVCYFIGIPVLNFIYYMDLNEYKISLLLVIVAAILYALAVVISNLLTILEENNKQFIIYLITSIISTLISILLIQQNGVTGAITAFLVSSILLGVSYFILLLYRIRTLQHKVQNN